MHTVQKSALGELIQEEWLRVGNCPGTVTNALTEISMINEF